MWMLPIIAVVPVALGIWWFNRLVAARNILREAWSAIAVLLKQRHDLVPNLVTTVKAYATHEQRTLEETIQARDATLPAEGTRAVSAAESHLTGKLIEVLALAEAYPDLKADTLFRQLMGDLVKVEDDLQYARRYFNGTVRDLNNLVEAFPSNLVAMMFQFRPADFFELDHAAEGRTPTVQLNP